MNIVFFGNTKYSVIGAEIIHQKYPLGLVVTIPDKPVGRDKTLTQSPTKTWAISKNIPVLEADKLDSEIIQKIAETNPAFLVVEDYGLILPKDLLELPKFAPINIHHSLLPKYRGPSPAQSTILAGDKVSGVTIIKMTEEVDSGDILGQKECELSEDETTDSLLKKLNELGGKLVIEEVIPNYLDNSIKPLVQDDALATYCNIIKKQDGYFEINSPPDPEKLDRMIRAYYPWPGVWTKWNGKIVKFLPNLQPTTHNLSPYLVQMEGKKPVPLKDFLNGYPDFTSLNH